jgi:hypothetical protein
MSSRTRWTDDFLHKIYLIKISNTKKNLTSGLYPACLLWQSCCCGSAWQIGLWEPFSGLQIVNKGVKWGKGGGTVTYL